MCVFILLSTSIPTLKRGFSKTPAGSREERARAHTHAGALPFPPFFLNLTNTDICWNGVRKSKVSFVEKRWNHS